MFQRLVSEGVQLNVTALMTRSQVETVSQALGPQVASCISVFAGRIADTGREPLLLMKRAVEIIQACSDQRLIWASPRELLNVFQADEIGCHVITVTHDIPARLRLVGKDLDAYSLETVEMLYSDAKKAGYQS